jgi:hypothetical protein
MKCCAAFLLLGLAACSTTSSMRDAQPTPPPGPDEAKVIVYRTENFGGAKHFPVYDDAGPAGKLLGFTETGCYFEFRCLPGRHLFFTWGEGDAFIVADLEPGKTYYIRAFSRFGILEPRPGFAPVGTRSEEWPKLDSILPKLRCRELEPEEAAAFEKKNRNAVMHLKEGFDQLEARWLDPGDGRGDPPILEAK